MFFKKEKGPKFKPKRESGVSPKPGPEARSPSRFEIRALWSLRHASPDDSSSRPCPSCFPRKHHMSFSQSAVSSTSPSRHVHIRQHRHVSPHLGARFPLTDRPRAHVQDPCSACPPLTRDLLPNASMCDTCVKKSNQSVAATCPLYARKKIQFFSLPKSRFYHKFIL